MVGWGARPSDTYRGWVHEESCHLVGTQDLRRVVRRTAGELRVVHTGGEQRHVVVRPGVEEAAADVLGTSAASDVSERHRQVHLQGLPGCAVAVEGDVELTDHP